MEHVITEATVHVDDDGSIRLTYDNPDGTAVVVARDLLEDILAKAHAIDTYLDTVIAPNVAAAIDVEPDTRLHELFLSGLLGQVTLRVYSWMVTGGGVEVSVTPVDPDSGDQS